MARSILRAASLSMGSVTCRYRARIRAAPARLAESGTVFALRGAVGLSRRAGRGDAADQLARYGWEPDGAIAGPWEARHQGL